MVAYLAFELHIFAGATGEVLPVSHSFRMPTGPHLGNSNMHNFIHGFLLIQSPTGQGEIQADPCPRLVRMLGVDSRFSKH